jgi:hypothetical protein
MIHVICSDSRQLLRSALPFVAENNEYNNCEPKRGQLSEQREMRKASANTLCKPVLRLCLVKSNRTLDSYS